MTELSEHSTEAGPATVVREAHPRDGILLALVAVLVCVVLGVTHHFAGDPFGGVAQAAPLVVGILIAVALAVAVAVRRGAVGTMGAVLIPCWIAFFCTWQLAGTPYAPGGSRFDIGRLSALATRFTVSTGSADDFVRGLPSDYPPLFPWVVGKASALTGIPAWRLLAPAAIVLTALSLVAGYLLWRRLFTAPLALAVSLVPLAYQGEPRKAYEVVALCVITPWILTTFGRWPQTRLHWLPAGVIGGLLVSDYLGYLVYTSAGIVAIVVMGLRAGTAWRYLRHVALTIVVAAVVSSWYLGPWLLDTLRHGSMNTWIYYFPRSARHNLLWLPWSRGPFISPLLIGGIVMMVVHCRKRAWARYLLALALSATLYRWVWAVIHHYTGNSGILEYTGRVTDTVETIALVLGLYQVWQDVVIEGRRPIAHRLRVLAAPAAVLAVLAAVVSVFWAQQRAGAPGRNYVKVAHLTALPDGSRPRYADRLAGMALPVFFPARAVRDDVESVLGRNALPVALSYDEQMSAYYPFYLYLGVGGTAANSLSLYPSRIAELRRLASIADPAACAAAAAHTRFGPIDVFILEGAGHGRLVWGRGPGRRVQFRSSQFAPRDFVRFHEANRTVVFVRRGAHVFHHSYPR